MKGIIWYAPGHKDLALEELDYIKSRYEDLKIEDVSSSRTANNTFITFANNDYWEVICACDSSRGRCCNISYVDRAIGIETFCSIVAPMTKGFPYTAFHFYGDGKLSYDIL